MPVLYGPNGQAEPSPEIQRRLRAVDPHLALRANPSGRGWWVLREWDERDPRRAMIRRGELSGADACDLLTEIPLDCPPDQVPSYLARLRRPGTPDEIVRLLDGLRAYNEGVVSSAMETAMADTLNRAEHAAERGFGSLPRVFSAGIPAAPPTPSAIKPGTRKRRERKRRTA